MFRVGPNSSALFRRLFKSEQKLDLDLDDALEQASGPRSAHGYSSPMRWICPRIKQRLLAREFQWIGAWAPSFRFCVR